MSALLQGPGEVTTHLHHIEIKTVRVLGSKGCLRIVHHCTCDEDLEVFGCKWVEEGQRREDTLRIKQKVRCCKLMSGSERDCRAKECGGWFEETRRTEKEECESIEIDYLNVKVSLELPSQRSKELHSRTQSETLEMKRRAQYTNGGGSVDSAKSNDQKVEVEGKRGRER